MADDNQDPRFADLPNYQGGVPDNSQGFTEPNVGQPMSGAGLNLPESPPDTGGNENVNLNPSGEGLPMGAPGQMAPGEKSNREDNAAGQAGPFAAPGLEATPDVPNIKDYFARTNAMSPQEWDAWKKKLDPQGNKPFGQVGLEIVAAQQPDNKIPALQANFKMADTGVAAAAAAANNGNFYKSTEFLNHAVPLIPALHDVSFSPTRDGVVINQGDQTYNLNSSQFHTLLHDPGFHPDMLQRNGLAGLISKVSQDRSPVGPQGPGSDAPNFDIQGPTQPKPPEARDENVPDPERPNLPNVKAGKAEGYETYGPTKEQIAPGYARPTPKPTAPGSKDSGLTPEEEAPVRGIPPDYYRQMTPDQRGYMSKGERQYTRGALFDQAAQGGQGTQPAPSPAQQGAQQFQSQLPQGRAANPRGRGTFIPDQRNPGHGAWTGGESVESPSQDAQNTASEPRPGSVGPNDMVNYMGQDMTHAQARELSEKFAAEHPQQPGWAASGTPVSAPQRNDRGRVVEQRGGGSSGGRTPAAQHTAEIQNQITDRTELANVYKEASHARANDRELTPIQKEVLDYYENNVMAKHRPQPQYTAQDTGIPPEALSKLQEGVETPFNNGQVWTKRGGQAIRVR